MYILYMACLQQFGCEIVITKVSLFLLVEVAFRSDIGIEVSDGAYHPKKHIFGQDFWYVLIPGMT